MPELSGETERVLRAVLPGPYTLVVPNPAERLPWIAGGRPGTLGVRVAELPALAAALVARVGAVVATSANEPGGASPAAIAEVPPRIRSACGAELDGGQLAGIASTVVDITGSRPIVLREGAGPIDRVQAAARLR